MDISIIIPMYNAEKYIERCIESIYKQGLAINDFEVLIINDGSTDNSPALVRSMMPAYTNLSLINKVNGGQGSARNLGIDSAVGNYIMFLDSDDYLPDAPFLSKLINIAVCEDVDILEFEMLVHSKDGKTYITDKKLEERVVYTGEQLLLNGFNPGSSCDKLFSRSFLVSNHFHFETEIAHEDSEFLYRVYPKADKIEYSYTCGYVYFYNIESTDRSLDVCKIKRRIYSDFFIAHRLRRLSEETQSPLLREYYRKRSNSLLYSLLLSLLTNRQNIHLEDVKQYLSICKYWGIYPITGNSMSKKVDCIVPILNVEFFYLFLNKLFRIWNHKNGRFLR